MAGWSESLNGMNGIAASAWYGLKRVNVGNIVFKTIPVDLCVKGMIIASERHKKGSQSSDAIPVYNAAAVHEFTLKTVLSLIDQLSDHFFEKAIGNPHVIIVENNILGNILRFLLQIVPALLIDGILLVMKRKPLIMKYQRILRYSEKAVEKFIEHEFEFETCKYQSLGWNLHKDDADDFYLLPRKPILEYFFTSLVVSKENVLKETAESSARAKKKIPYWRALGWFIKALFLFIAYKIFLVCCETV